jgi:hypothetical protein
VDWSCLEGIRGGSDLIPGLETDWQGLIDGSHIQSFGLALQPWTIHWNSKLYGSSTQQIGIKKSFTLIKLLGNAITGVKLKLGWFEVWTNDLIGSSAHEDMICYNEWLKFWTLFIWLAWQLILHLQNCFTEKSYGLTLQGWKLKLNPGFHHGIKFQPIELHLHKTSYLNFLRLKWSCVDPS